MVQQEEHLFDGRYMDGTECEPSQLRRPNSGGGAVPAVETGRLVSSRSVPGRSRLPKWVATGLMRG